MILMRSARLLSDPWAQLSDGHKKKKKKKGYLFFKNSKTREASEIQKIAKTKAKNTTKNKHQLNNTSPIYLVRGK